jgi:hypothetical protein
MQFPTVRVVLQVDKTLKHAGAIRNACAADGQHQPRLVVDRERVRARAKDDAVDSTPAEIETSVTCEEAKVAVSVDPLGTVAGVQLAAVFESPLLGCRFHIALPAFAFDATANARVKMTLGLIYIVFFLPSTSLRERP